MKYRKIAYNVFVGKNFRKNKNVILGCRSLRDIKRKPLYIGDNARCLENSIIYENTKIGAGLIIGHNSVIREENKIGDRFFLWNNSSIDYGCIIGNNVKIHCNVYIAQFTCLEDDVFIAPGVMIANDLHPGCTFSNKCMKGPVLKKGAKIGINSTINPFVTIGEGSVIGSNSLVVEDIPDGVLAFGHPAKIIKKISQITCPRGLIDFPFK